jgi:uncharacterized membrane protein (GlpM family)
MLALILKTLLTAVMVVAIAEVGKRTPVLGGLMASLPVNSLLAMLLLYHDTQNPQSVGALATNILWFVVPSLILFILFPLLLKRGVSFYPALGLSCVATMAMYGLTATVGRLTHWMPGTGG